ncbi:MAG: BamA/TamA family outer membrane protein, partial [Okeania sp. SIO2H7]|nr:BamA/TamA family outer membrane protein [Okeania sp. SIO2H7]
GDNGFRFSIEDRITFERDESGLPTIQFIPFIDAGAVWNNSDNPNNEFLPSQRFLVGVGLGLLWQPVPQFNLRLDYGIPLIDLDDRGNNAQDSGFYFSVIFRP